MAEVMNNLVRFVTKTDYVSLPADVADYIKRICLSQLAAVVGGVDMPVSKIVLRLAKGHGGSGEAGVAGHRFKAPVSQAALCNAVFAHATELEDDIFPDRSTIGTIIPAMFTLGDALKSSGPDLMASIIVGFDVQAKMALTSRAGYKGSMAFSTGGWGTAASAAKLMKLDADQMRTTMSIACSLAGGLLHQVPSMMHFMESGVAARDGILAAQWAQAGISANPDIIEVHEGFWDLFAQERGALASFNDMLTADLRLMRVGIKKYGCAYLMQRIIDGALELRDRHGITYENVASVELHVAPWFDEFLRRNPKTVDEARFSASHVLAGILLGEPVDLHTFSEKAIHDLRYRESEEKVVLVTHEERGHNRFDGPDELIIKMKDGREHRKMCEVAKGSPPFYLNEEEVMNKFRSAAKFSGYLSDDVVERIGKLVLSLEKVRDVSEITDLITFGGQSVAALRAV
jgi:2-methylcitrate dehydratase PrpD